MMYKFHILLSALALAACTKPQNTRTATYRVQCHKCYVAYDTELQVGDRIWLQGNTIQTTVDSLVINGQDTSVVQVPITIHQPAVWELTQTIPDYRSFVLFVQQETQPKDTVRAAIIKGSSTVRSAILISPSHSERLTY